MKTMLFAPCYLNDDINDEPFQSYRLTRNQKWLEYMFALQGKLNFEAIYLIDNASKMDRLISLGGNIYDKDFNLLYSHTKYLNLHIIRFEEHLPRVSFDIYHYWWRAMFMGWQTIRNKYDYKKVIHIDTDMYILSQKIVDYINNTNTGFNSFYCPMYMFADSTFQFICQDSFPIIDEFIANTKDFSQYNHKVAETIIPFNNIIKEFKGDRYGEKVLAQTSDMDYYGQCLNEIVLKYNL